jgi:cytochrome P450
LKQLFEGFNEFAVINQTGTAALIDFFPVLRLLPDFVLPTQKKARELHKIEKQLYLSHWMKCKNSVKSGTAQPCFCIDMTAAQDAEGFSDDQAAYISGTLLEAGSDTTSSTLYGFVQAMVLFPEVQKRAQEELDRVVGKDRLPEMEDMDSLQYIRGCMKESLRWMPTTIIGAVPHAVTKDDEYMGYVIPKGAGVLNNVYAIHHDAKRFPDPRRFDPDRYKDDRQSLYEAASNPDASKRDTFTFGAGRRICAGMHVAERSLFLGISRLLWAFDIAPAVDRTTGKVLMPDPEKLTQGFVCMPEPYQAAITPRSPERAEVIKHEWEQAQKSLDPKTKQWIEVPKSMGLPSL